MKKKIVTIVLLLIFLLGLGILLYPTVANWWNSRVQSKVIMNYESVLEEMDTEEYDAYFKQADVFNRKLLSMKDPLYHTEELTEYEDLLAIDSDKVMGYIAIEKLEVEIPIYHGTSDAALAAGVGHMKGTSLPVGGKGCHCALSAHRGLPSSKLFSDLDKLEIGDTFTITVLDRLITYQVDQILIVEPEEMGALQIDPDGDFCTLVTCTPYGINTHRLLVRGTRIDNAAEKPKIHIRNEAIRISPMLVASVVFIPILAVALAFYLGGHRKRKK